jgi:hypothetical protein
MARSIGRHYTLHINVGVQHTVILTYATKPSVNKDGAVALIFPKSMTSTATPSTHMANVWVEPEAAKEGWAVMKPLASSHSTYEMRRNHNTRQLPT